MAYLSCQRRTEFRVSYVAVLRGRGERRPEVLTVTKVKGRKKMLTYLLD
jgi:hypothetical protein